MKTTQHVYIPTNRHRDDANFVSWCSENISYYSTEMTWVADRTSTGFLIYRFSEHTDALAFKLRFGL